MSKKIAKITSALLLVCLSGCVAKFNSGSSIPSIAPDGTIVFRESAGNDQHRKINGFLQVGGKVKRVADAIAYQKINPDGSVETLAATGLVDDSRLDQTIRELALAAVGLKTIAANEAIELGRQGVDRAAIKATADVQKRSIDTFQTFDPLFSTGQATVPVVP